jgi:hypothetical protein
MRGGGLRSDARLVGLIGVRALDSGWARMVGCVTANRAEPSVLSQKGRGGWQHGTFGLRQTIRWYGRGDCRRVRFLLWGEPGCRGLRGSGSGSWFGSCAGSGWGSWLWFWFLVLVGVPGSGSGSGSWLGSWLWFWFLVGFLALVLVLVPDWVPGSWLGSWFWFWFWLGFGTRVLFRGLTLASVRDLDLVLVLVPDSYWGSWFGMSFWFGPCAGSVGGGDESAAILAAASVG